MMPFGNPMCYPCRVDMLECRICTITKLVVGFLGAWDNHANAISPEHREYFLKKMIDAKDNLRHMPSLDMATTSKKPV